MLNYKTYYCGDNLLLNWDVVTVHLYGEKNLIEIANFDIKNCQENMVH